ncbi:hypothetical protein KEM56_006643 [Ascosphaera pollenicola]|nr:hypothetical protein KEM56_006643 [Ascosphaera pollenicola]
MAPRSPLSIATQSLQRLVKEEASYHRELEQQEERIKRLTAEPVADDDDGNREYFIKQEKQALEETKKIFPSLKQKINESLAKLEQLLVEEGQKGEASNVEEIDAAKDAVAKAKTAIRESS